MAGRRADYGSISASAGAHERGAARGRSRLAPWAASVALMLLGTAAVALVAQGREDGRATALLKAQAARRGRGRQGRLARAAAYGVNSGNFEKLGIAGAATGVGNWLVKAFPGEFLNTEPAEALPSNQTADPEDCDCGEIRHCFICLKDDAFFEEHRHDEVHDGGGAGEHEPAEHTKAAPAHTGHKAMFDKQMLRFAVSGLSGDGGEDHGEEGHSHHEEYHPVEFFHYRPNCCEFPMKDKIENPDASFDEPCYWDAEELNVKDWSAYGHPVVCTKSDFKEAHTLVNTLSTWAVAAICLLWMIGLVVLHQTIHNCWHGGHGGDHHDHGDEMKADHGEKKQGPGSGGPPPLQARDSFGRTKSSGKTLGERGRASSGSYWKSGVTDAPI